MKNLSMIACVSEDLGLGYEGGLLWHIPEDMKFFKNTTMGHPVVMGGKTFQSIGRALPGRENIVLSRSEIDGVKVCHSKDELDAYIASKDEEVFVIGGGSLYAMFVNEAENIYLTEVRGKKSADAYFPEFNKNDFAREVLDRGNYQGVDYEMVKYVRKHLS